MQRVLSKKEKKELYSILIGSSILSLNAGFISAITFSGVFAVPVSRLTGNLTQIATSAIKQNFADMILVSAIVLAFTLGSFTSGFIVGSQNYRLGRGYGVALLLESSALLCCFATLSLATYNFGEIFAAYAFGIQNALTSAYSGAVIRTTHMTGIITDVGSLLGQTCRAGSKKSVGYYAKWKALKVHLTILCGFLIGGLSGQLCFSAIGPKSILASALLTGVLGILYYTLPVIRKARTEYEEQLNNRDSASASPLSSLKYGLSGKRSSSSSTINNNIQLRSLKKPKNGNSGIASSSSGLASSHSALSTSSGGLSMLNENDDSTTTTEKSRHKSRSKKSKKNNSPINISSSPTKEPHYYTDYLASTHDGQLTGRLSGVDAARLSRVSRSTTGSRDIPRLTIDDSNIEEGTVEYGSEDEFIIYGSDIHELLPALRYPYNQALSSTSHSPIPQRESKSCTEEATDVDNNVNDDDNNNNNATIILGSKKLSKPFKDGVSSGSAMGGGPSKANNKVGNDESVVNEANDSDGLHSKLPRLPKRQDDKNNDDIVFGGGGGIEDDVVTKDV